MSSTAMSAQDRSAVGRPDHSRSVIRYWVAGLLGVFGMAGAVTWAIVTQAAVAAYANGFVRANVPGEITLRVDHPDTYYVYAEGTRWLHPTVQVTDPSGRIVPVKATSPGPSYYHGGNGGGAVGKFEAIRTGKYRVTAATGTITQGDFAVGGSTAQWWAEEWGPAALLVTAVGASIFLAVVTTIRRRRSRVRT